MDPVFSIGISSLWDELRHMPAGGVWWFNVDRHEDAISLANQTIASQAETAHVAVISMDSDPAKIFQLDDSQGPEKIKLFSMLNHEKGLYYLTRDLQCSIDPHNYLFILVCANNAWQNIPAERLRSWLDKMNKWSRLNHCSLTAPLAFLLLHAYIIYAPALMIALFVLPHMIHASLTNSKIQGKYRHSFWSEIYETVLAWYIAPPTLVALINPHKGKFNVTAKGGLVEEEYVDWVISRPYIFLVLLNLVGVAVGIWRYFYGPPTEMLTVVVSMVWVFYNLIVLGGAVAVSVESKQVRRSHRVEMTMPAAIAREDGHLFSCTVQDFSDGGLGIKINGQAQILEGQKVNLLLKRGQQEYVFPTQVARVMGNEVGLKLMPLTTQQHIDFVQCTFARADTWALWQDSYPEDKPLESLLDILKLGFRGYRHLAEFAPSSVKGIFRVLTSLVSWVVSFIPRRPERSETAQPSDQALAQQ